MSQTLKEEEIRSRQSLNTYLDLVQKDCQVYFQDKTKFKKINCCACNSTATHPEFSKNGFEYVLCQDCGTLFVQNRPPQDKLKEFYASSESTSYWVNSFFKPVMNVRREKIFRPRVQAVVQMFAQEQKEWTVGDVGAGFGIFLEELKKDWPTARLIAIEPSLEQAEICRNAGLEVECCLMEDLQNYDQKFDLLISFELFEHLLNPRVFAKKIFKLLKPGGYFFMTTLNGQGFDIQLLWEKSKAVTPPHHLNFFNPGSISKLLNSEGFKIEKVTTPGGLDWDIVEGMIKKENVSLGRFWDLFAKQGTQEAKDELQNWIKKHNLSSHMHVLARKP